MILSCNANGTYFAEKFRSATEEIQSLEIDVASVTQLNHELRIETEKYHQIAVDLRNETDQCQLESGKCTEEKEKWIEEKNSLKIDLQECSSSQHNSLQSTGHIGISVVRHVKDARETDLCVGTITSSGYITSSSCCQADQMFLFEFENSTEIAVNMENSIWIEDQICFINTTDTFKFHFPALDGAETQNCTFLTYDYSQGVFNEHQIEMETKGCVNSTCNWKIDSFENEMIPDGTSIVCNGSLNFGIFTNS